jgi:hypothetical protein
MPDGPSGDLCRGGTSWAGGHCLGLVAAFTEAACDIAGGQENKSTRDDNCGYQSQQRFHDVLAYEGSIWIAANVS